MSRHEMDLENSISHDQQKAKSLSILMTNVKPDTNAQNLDDPMSNIKELLQKVERGESQKFLGQNNEDSESSDDEEGEDRIPPPSCMTFKAFMKESKEQVSQRRVVDIPQSECPDCAKSTVECYYHSRRRKEETSDQVVNGGVTTDTEQRKSKRKKKRHKKKDTGDTRKCGLIEMKQTATDIDLEPIPIEVIQKYRISSEQIKEIDRFKEYSPGQPSKVSEILNKTLLLVIVDDLGSENFIVSQTTGWCR